MTKREYTNKFDIHQIIWYSLVINFDRHHL